MIRPTCEDTFIIKKINLKNDYYSLTFQAYSRVNQCKPGYFIQLQLPSRDIFFRRPMSIANVSIDTKEIEVIFKIFGYGTKVLSQLQIGDCVNILGPLGVSFKFPRKSEKVIIIAGGVGFPPLLYLVSEMVKKNYNPDNIEFFYGGKSKGDILVRNRIKKTGINFHPVTEDGSFGSKGLITERVEKYIKDKNKSKMRIYGCGPVGMLKVVNELALRNNISGQISLEAPMPCGIGICLGCVVPLTKGGYARVCHEGPVFNIGEVAL